jgi:hypothetical protein
MMGDGFFGVKLPAREVFDEVSHVPETRNPGTIQRDLWMDQQRGNDRSGLISLGAFSQVGSVNSAYIAATDRAGFHLDKDLAMPRPFYADHGRMQAVSVRNLLDDRIHDIDGVGRSAVTVRAAG